MTRLHLTWSLERSPVKSRLSRVPWLRSPRAPPTGASYTGAPLAALSIGSSAVCTLRTVLHSSGGVVDPAGYFSCCGRCGHRQISTVTRFQAHPSGPYSRAAGGSFLTGAVLKARSARGVSGSFGRSVLKPQLPCRVLSFCSKPCSFTNSK